jgi:carotenoid cleavage dioxygenase-like enzyme
MMYDSNNPFLSGNYAPWREEGDELDLLVDGEIPKELNGSLYRIGPNPHYPPQLRYHWFDGDGMVHGFTIRDGKASYRNRYVKTAGLEAEMRAGKSLFGGLAAMPKEIRPEGAFKNAANTNIIGYANRLLALWEAGWPHELKPETLETVGLYGFGNKLMGPMTAHPKFDAKTGELLFFGYQPVAPFVTWHRADTRGNLIESHPIDTGLPVMMHDFVTTENYAIFFVCPSVFRLENAAQGKPVLQWEPDHGTRIGAMNRKTFEVKWFQTESFYVFHFLNAYEENNSLTVDFCRMPSLDMTGNGPSGQPHPYRFMLDMKDGSVKQTQIDDEVNEFPRIDDRLAGYRHRYGYFAASRPATGIGFTRLTARDYQKNSAATFSLGPNMAPGEPVFVPRPHKSGEQDGWVLSVWYDGNNNRSELVIQDAADFSGKPVARVKLSHRVPFGFHGNWVPAAA